MDSLKFFLYNLSERKCLLFIYLNSLLMLDILFLTAESNLTEGIRKGYLYISTFSLYT